MILNVWTVTAFFLAAVGALLALAVLLTAARGLVRRTTIDAGEDRVHLLVLLIGVLAGVRFLAWPHFYLLLKSYVPALSGYGVMCAFGVTRIEPELVLAAQWIKPVLLAGLGFWLVRSSGSYFSRCASALALALVALMDCAVEAIYLVRDKVGTPVTCCTQFLDTEAARGTARTGLALPGLAGSEVPVGIYVAFNVLLLVAGVFLARRGRRGRVVPRVLLPWLVGVAALVNLALTRGIWLEEVAPRVLQLPYHHCVYELLTDVPALGFAALSLVVGNVCLLWPLGLPPDSTISRTIYALCAVALSTGLLIVGVHLA